MQLSKMILAMAAATLLVAGCGKMKNEATETVSSFRFGSCAKATPRANSRKPRSRSSQRRFHGHR